MEIIFIFVPAIILLIAILGLTGRDSSTIYPNRHLKTKEDWAAARKAAHEHVYGKKKEGE